jgi:hypothetical protein
MERHGLSLEIVAIRRREAQPPREHYYGATSERRSLSAEQAAEPGEQGSLGIAVAANKQKSCGGIIMTERERKVGNRPGKAEPFRRAGGGAEGAGELGDRCCPGDREEENFLRRNT